MFDADPDPAVAAFFGSGRKLIADRFEQAIAPSLVVWGTTDAAHKLPVIVELFMSASEGAVRSMLSAGNTWAPDELGEFVGKSVYRAFRDA